MASFCDRSPCPRMLEALGRWVFGNDDGGYTAVTGSARGEGKYYDTIEYCPFCGTHLDQLSLAAKGTILIG